jgi:AcrR family transcriptional regulator
MPYRPTERTEARRTRTRERIVDAALAQVAAGGYASASVQAVASRAGVATGSVYRHFPSKSELFAEVFGRTSKRELDVLEAVAAHTEGTAAERIGAVVETFARRALAGPVLAYAQMAEPVGPRVEAERLALRRGYRDLFAALLREGIAAGELPESDVATVSAGLVGAIGEALVGPLSPVSAHGATTAAPRQPAARHEALVAALVQFCFDAVGKERAHGRRRPARHAPA